MNIQQYIAKKYEGRVNSLLSEEAIALGIPFPLEGGWLRRHGHEEIRGEKLRRLHLALERSQKRSPRAGLHVLEDIGLVAPAGHTQSLF